MSNPLKTGFKIQNLSRLKIIYLLNALNMAVLMLVQIALVPVYLRYLGVHGYEQWVFISSIGFMLLVLDFGMIAYNSNSMRIAYGQGDSAAAQKALGQGLSVFSYVFILFALAAAVLGLLAGRETEAALAIVVLHVPFSQFRSWLASVFTARVSQIGELIFFITWTLAQTALLLAILFCGGGLVALALGQLATTILTGILPVYWALRRMTPDIRLSPVPIARAEIADFVKGCLANFGYTAASTAVVYLPVILLGVIPVLPPGTLATFTVSRTLTGVVRQFCQQLARSNVIEISRHSAPEHQGRARRLFLIGSAVISVLAAIGMGGLLPVADLVVKIWTRKPELYDPLVIGLFCVTATISAQLQLPMVLPQFTNRARMMSWPLCLQVCLLAVLGLTGGYFFGAAGMVVALGVAETSTLGFVAIRKIIPESGLTVPDFLMRTSVPSLIAFALSLAASAAGRFLIHPTGFIGLACNGAIWTLVVLPALALFYRRIKKYEAA